MKKTLVVLALGGSLSAGSLQQAALQQEFERLTQGFDGRVGMCARDASGAVCVNAGQRFSLRSVIKLAGALAVMDAVDRQSFQLDAPVLVRKRDLNVGVQPIAAGSTGCADGEDCRRDNRALSRGFGAKLVRWRGE